MDIKGTILRAKDGHPVPVLERDGLKRHLGSMYDGAVAASCWCEKVVGRLVLQGDYCNLQQRKAGGHGDVSAMQDAWAGNAR